MKNFFKGKMAMSEGSGTILGLGMCLVGLSGLLACNLAGFALFSGQKLQAEADEIAIAAADSARGLITGFPCESASQIAHIYMVSLDTCRIVGFESFIRLRSVAAGFELMATSRAGPAENN
jgi:hypothetical protein